MPESPPDVLPVALWALHRGTELQGDGTLAWSDEGVELRAGAGTMSVRLAELDGVRYRDAELTLYLRGGDVAQLSGTPRLAMVGRELLARAARLPELTRPLRTLGAHGPADAAEHDRFFGPLLAARRRAERAADPLAQAAAFDAQALATAFDEAVRSFAAARCPDDPRHRRALEAELRESTERVHERLAALGASAAVLVAGEDDDRLERWRAWLAVLATLFDAADRCWMALAPRLAAFPPPRRGWWRRFGGGGAGGRR